jgi:hypothetical protein
MTILGDGKEFVGLVPLIRQFLDGANIDVESLSKINRYLDLIQVCIRLKNKNGKQKF